MKWLVLLVCLVASAVAEAAPFVYTEPLPAGTTSCGFLLDAGAKVVVPVKSTAGVLTCEADLSGISTGAHSVKFTTIANDPVWGVQESPPSVVAYAFSRPAAPPPPVVSGLKP